MFLDIQDAIVDRLKAAEPDAHIAIADELADLEERQQRTPAIHVIYQGYTPTRDLGEGHIQEIQTVWTVVVAVRSAREGGTREQAGPLLDAAFTALAGQRPTPDTSPLRLQAGPGSVHRPGFSYYPLTFATRQTVRGATPV